jgi:hypothetical protein
MNAGPQTQIIFVGGADFGRKAYPKPYPAKPRGECWRPATRVPNRAAYREMVRQLLARPAVERKAIIDHAKAMLRAAG